MKPKITIISTGHIDHGKSTLVGRIIYELKQQLTNWGAVDISNGNFANFLDQLEEERVGQMTIDVVHSQVEGKKYQLEFIDAPGHKEFIQNMMTGASDAEGAQLVVSVAENEGIEEQTVRHLFLLKLFGINQIIVAVNKMDRVNYSESRYNILCAEIKKIMGEMGIDYSNIYFVPISARQGENVTVKSEKMAWWQGKSYIDTLEDYFTPKEDLSEKPFLMPVQDIYEISGEKIIIGKVESGTLNKGDEIFFPLSGFKACVSAILEFGNEKELATVGDSIGLKIECGDAKEVSRGDVCSKDFLLIPKSKIKVKSYVIGEEIGLNQEVSVRIGTRSSLGKVVSIKEIYDPAKKKETFTSNAEKIVKDNSGELEIELSEPIVGEPFSAYPPLGRVIISSGAIPQAAGVVL